MTPDPLFPGDADPATAKAGASASPGNKPAGDTAKKAAAAVRTRTRKKAGRPTARQQTVASLEDRLGESFAGIGLVVLAVSPADGVVIIERGPALATALAQWAAENPQVKRVLESMLNVSTGAQVLMALASIAIPIAGNHGLVPPAAAAMFGPVEVPEGLSNLIGGQVPDYPPPAGE